MVSPLQENPPRPFDRVLKLSYGTSISASAMGAPGLASRAWFWMPGGSFISAVRGIKNAKEASKPAVQRKPSLCVGRQ
jgi:hypothetical protein